MRGSAVSSTSPSLLRSKRQDFEAPHLESRFPGNHFTHNSKSSFEKLSPTPPRPSVGTISELEQISTLILSHCTVGETGQGTHGSRWVAGPKPTLPLLSLKLTSSLVPSPRCQLFLGLGISSLSQQLWDRGPSKITGYAFQQKD